MKSKDTKNQPVEMSQSDSEKGSEGADHSKRKLLKGLVTTAPVVMAMSSKPALANFCTVSGFLSGNLSNPNGQTYCGGRSPGYWINHVPEKYVSTTFKDVFGANWGSDWMPDPTLYEVLKMGGGDDRFQFGAHAVAAFLNADPTMPPDYPLSVLEVGDMVGQILLSGSYFHPGTGQTLDAQQVVLFFEGTFDAD